MEPTAASKSSLLSNEPSSNAYGTSAQVSENEGDDGLTPIAPAVSTTSKIASALLSLLMLPVYLIGGLFALLFLVLFVFSGVGPFMEFCYARSDRRTHLDRDTLLEAHPEMFLLDVPGEINKASNGHPYQVMVRLTRPKEPQSAQLPPIIMPGGLASNLMTLSRHQDSMTQQHGLTVVNFDRLGVGWSDEIPAPAQEGGKLVAPSAADVAREMNHVMTNIPGIRDTTKWIAVGSSMGANVATAYTTLFPNRLAGFFNLDGLPHAFLQIQCKKFLNDGNAFMTIMKKLQWTGLPRLAFTAALRPLLPVLGDAFTARQQIGVMCRNQFFTTTGLEYATLMSCCDLEVAAWGALATTEYDATTLRIMASLAPDESVVIGDASNGTDAPRIITQERSESELGAHFLTREDQEVVAVESRLRSMILSRPEDVDRNKTHCNWPEPVPRHPVGDFVGGVDATTPIYPLAPQFQEMCVRVTCARSYKGLERDYVQEARNHAAARTSLHVIMSGNSKSFYYPQLSHLNLWQQVHEIVDITFKMAQHCSGGASSV